MTGKIQSSTTDAHAAISELTGLATGATFQSLTFGESTVTSMLTAKELANTMMNDIGQLASCILTQANKFPALAETIEQRDQADARSWQGPRR